MLGSFIFLLDLGLMLINFLPDSFSLSLPSDMLVSAAYIFQGITFFLPLGTFITIFGLKCCIHGLRLSIAIFKLILKFIPGVG